MFLSIVLRLAPVLSFTLPSFTIHFRLFCYLAFLSGYLTSQYRAGRVLFSQLPFERKLSRTVRRILFTPLLLSYPPGIQLLRFKYSDRNGSGGWIRTNDLVVMDHPS